MKKAGIALILFLVGCNAEPPKEVQAPDQKWTWSIERLEKAVNQVRAGMDLTPKSWPNGAKVAVLVNQHIAFHGIQRRT